VFIISQSLSVSSLILNIKTWGKPPVVYTTSCCILCCHL